MGCVCVPPIFLFFLHCLFLSFVFPPHLFVSISVFHIGTLLKSGDPWLSLYYTLNAKKLLPSLMPTLACWISAPTDHQPTFLPLAWPTQWFPEFFLPHHSCCSQQGLCNSLFRVPETCCGRGSWGSRLEGGGTWHQGLCQQSLLPPLCSTTILSHTSKFRASWGSMGQTGSLPFCVLFCRLSRSRFLCF